jgi:hypothetical protein
MTVISRLEKINGFFGAIYLIESPGTRIDFGGVPSNPDEICTSVTVLGGNVKVSGNDKIYSEGQEINRPITELCAVESVTPGAKLFHTLKKINEVSLEG